MSNIICMECGEYIEEEDFIQNEVEEGVYEVLHKKCK